MEQASMDSKFKMLLSSRKFWAALVGVAMVIIKSYDPKFPLSDQQVGDLVYVLIAYILGTALEDAGASKGSAIASAVEGLLGATPAVPTVIVQTPPASTVTIKDGSMSIPVGIPPTPTTLP